MKKLTTTVLAVVLTSSFVMVDAQKTKSDTIVKTTTIADVTITGVLGRKVKVDAQTTANQVVSKEQLTQASNPNALSAMVGKVSGVTISQTNNSVGGTNSIVIRNPRTITGSNEALVVIDGVISSATALQQLSPEVIESVNVIKGSGAAAYGSQGVNGVVVVTTVRGTKNKRIRTTFNSSADFENIAFMPERQQKYGQGWDGHKISVENGAWGPAFSTKGLAGTLLPYGPSFSDINGDGYIEFNPNGDKLTPDDSGAIMSKFAPYGKDNVRDFFQTGTLFQNTLTVNGGDSDTYFLMSLGSVEREFVVENDKLSRYTGMFKGGVKLNKWRFDGILNYSRQNSSTTDSDIYHQLLQSSSDIPITAFKNYRDRGYAWNVYYQNPYFYIKHDRHNSLRNYFNIVGSAEYTMNDHINILYRGNVQYTNVQQNDRGDGWSDIKYLSDITDTGSTIKGITSYYNEYNQNSSSYYGDLLLNFDYDLTKDINAKLTLGHNYQEWAIKNNQAGGTGIIIPNLYQIWNLTNPTNPYSLNNTKSHSNMHAFLGILDVSYRDYLYLNATGRYEMSSRLPMDNRSYFFPAVSMSFVPTKAFPSIKGDVLNYMKITAAYQKTGNVSAIGVYDVYDRMLVGSGFPYDVAGPTKGALSFTVDTAPTDNKIRPEFTAKQELGLELAFFKDRITFDGAVYTESTTDLITRQTTSNASGISSKLMNLGKLDGRGIEANINFVPIKTRDFRWDIGGNFTSYRTRVSALSEDAKEIRLAGNNFVGLYAVEGQEFPVIKGTTYMRDSQGRIIVDATTGLPTVNSKMEILGKTTPKYIVGFNSSVSYKGLRLSTTMDYRTGHKFYSGTLQGFTFNGMNIASASFDRDQPYIVPNSVYLSNGAYVANTSVPIYATTTNNPASQNYNPHSALASYFGGSRYNSVGENFILDASAFKIREISLSYSLSKDVLDGTGISGLTIGVHARNPFYKFASDNKGYDDPETAFDPRYKGLANPDQYPNLKSFGGSFSVTF